MEKPGSGRNRKDKTFLRRLRNVVASNLAVAAVLSLLFWWFTTHGAPQEIWKYCKMGLVYSNVYGLLLGLSMPYLGQRFAALRSPLKWIVMVVTLVALTAAGSLIVGVILVWMRVHQPDEFWPIFAGNLATGSIISLIVGFSIGLYEGIRDKIESTTLQLRAQELEKERALKLASEAQLASLESRLRPHFLFNTLNSISALIHEDPARAERMVQRFSALLRYSLDTAAHRTVPLFLEMKIVAEYLEIEKERFGDRLEYSLDFPVDIEQLAVPPLSVQTLVENSVRHAIGPFSAGGAIRVMARAQEGRLFVDVWDSGPGFNTSVIPNGRGLGNLQDRLATLFGDSSSVTVYTMDAGSLVTISLPQMSSEVVECK